MTSSPSPLSLLLLFVVLIFTRSPLVVAQSSPPVNLTILSASGDGDCVNVAGIAFNCTLPFILNLTVVYLPIPVPPTLNLALSGGYQWFYSDLPTATFTSSLISTRVSVGQFNLPLVTPLGMYLSALVIVNGTSVYQRWGPASVFSLGKWNYPTVTAVTGCQSTSRALLTTNCVPEEDVLMLTGS